MIKKLSLVLLIPVIACASTRIEKVIAKSQDKVVKIGIITEKYHGVCSGAIISPTGEVLTCAHCFEDKGIRKVFIKTAKGEVYRALPLKIDFKKDLAVIQPIDGETMDFPYFNLGKMPVIGQQVISFGSPLGIQGTATTGWVDNIKDDIVILHSAFISPGNSGGPLVDLSGRLIGVNKATLMYGFLQTAQGLFVAISVDDVRAFLGEK